MIFKDNLKLITNTLIELVWREKVKTHNIQETIQNAFHHIYKGAFDEIAEVDEEHMQSSRLEFTERAKASLLQNPSPAKPEPPGE